MPRTIVQINKIIFLHRRLQHKPPLNKLVQDTYFLLTNPETITAVIISTKWIFYTDVSSKQYSYTNTRFIFCTNISSNNYNCTN